MLNNITFAGIGVADTDGRGLGVIAEKDLSNENDGLPALLTIPNDLILSAESVEEYAKENKDFRELLDAAGHQVEAPISSSINRRANKSSNHSQAEEMFSCSY